MGPPVKRLMKSNSFLKKLSPVVKRAWKSFVSVVESLLGNHKAAHFRDIVEKLVDAYGKMNCGRSLKLHVLHVLLSCR